MEGSNRGRRVTQRRPLSCTECNRRKLKCSRVIPCSSCLDRGNSHLCRREDVVVRNKTASARRASHVPKTPSIPADTNVEQQVRPVLQPPTRSPIVRTPATTSPAISIPAVSPSSRPLAPRTIDTVAQDAAITLEFLALGRQRVLGLGRDCQTETPAATVSIADDIVTPEQTRLLIDYHEKNIAWMHNVVHMPTFRSQCESFLETGVPPNQFWLSLYYAILSCTVYLTLPEILLQYGIENAQSLAERLHKMSLDALHASNFMAIHSLVSVQTICMLIHVGHNLGESDLISTLTGCAIRIAQSLSLHRLGQDVQNQPDSALAPHEVAAKLIEREICKKAWWFLIRQDWLQIPFLNTYTIHASQFNTPMPRNCFEEPELCVQNGQLIEQDTHTYTINSYTTVLNQIAVLIWKTQDRMCSLGHPNGVPNGVRKLYEEVMMADVELKKIMKQMPIFFREDRPNDLTLPTHVKQQKEVLLLAFSHKFLTIHRHFQVSSYKSLWFSYTKLSCLSIARRSLQSIWSLPEDEHTWIARNFWTVNTHIVTATIAIMFEDLFAPNEEHKMFDSQEIRDLAQQSSQALHELASKSQIAKKGARIIDSLLEMQRLRTAGRGEAFNLEQIIQYVKAEVPPQTDAEMDISAYIMDPLDDAGLSALDWQDPKNTTWDSILGLMGGDDWSIDVQG